MKTTPANAEAEAVPELALRDADKLLSRELRKAIAKYIELQREAVKDRRRKLN
ncbi:MULTISPECIES: hypothetical protein [Bradyrhizobium]|uniref:hypothetical protein n=1 Tax=Bradyrhizobium TaxID=374 RepID=UPI0013E8DED2|nr:MULTISPECIES: hypothetical protein [Bradyrhizobium]